jgi:class 3 adenylate cyclase
LFLSPNKGMEDNYVTNQPVIILISTVLIFLFTSVVFICYDCMVEYRQKKILKTATQTSAIVSSLFPSTVRDRLFESDDFAPEESKKKNKKKAFQFKGNEASQISAFLADGVLPGDSAHGGMVKNTKKSKPIADLFPETTICFADLAGFTKWSSSRTPTEVFELLETLYSAFDLCAKRRNVFKVETIGDCYVAVTGIPKPQENHAAIMVKFARDCMMKMSQLTKDLADQLGEDTMELEMRVGLHSGPTTGGVLRGDKGRFQLFGDTVNTASRMESNGVRGRIHVSQATADALTKQGKEHWLTPREDMIVAKGKGEMQTYFVSAISSAKSVATFRVGGSERGCSTSDDDDDEEDAGEVMGSGMAADEAELIECADDAALGMSDLDALERRLSQRLTQNTSGSTVNMELLFI